MRGFTLIELLVVISIIMVISALVFTNQGAFNRTVTLANTAYDVALSIRTAETYGIDSKSIGGDANVGYGIDFQNTTPNSFRLFADAYPGPTTNPASCHPSANVTMPDARAGDCVYEAGKDKLVSVYSISNGVTISKFCAETAGSWACSGSGTGALSSLDVVFVRPDPTPYISTNGFYNAAAPATAACLTLVSSQGGTRSIQIMPSGEIVANASACP